MTRTRNDTNMRDGGSLENALGRKDVAANVERKRASETADAGLPSQVEHAVEPGEVQLASDEIDRRNVEGRAVQPFPCGVVIVTEIVDRDDVVAADRKRLDQMRSNEARRACHQISHGRERRPTACARFRRPSYRIVLASTSRAILLDADSWSPDADQTKLICSNPTNSQVCSSAVAKALASAHVRYCRTGVGISHPYWGYIGPFLTQRRCPTRIP